MDLPLIATQCSPSRATKAPSTRWQISANCPKTMWTADDRRSRRTAETAADRCLDRWFFFFFVHSYFPMCRTPAPSERGAAGSHYPVLRGPGPFNIRPPSSICSRRHTDPWFLFQRVSGKQMRCSCCARSGKVLTAIFRVCAYNLSTPLVIKVALSSGALYYLADGCIR